MVSALLLLVVGLSLPTIMQLAEFLRLDPVMPSRAVLVKIQAPSADRPGTETRLAH
jgi:hypothetical protein